MRTIEAEHDSHCDWCDEPIEAGDDIAHDDHYGWCHADCARAADDSARGR